MKYYEINEDTARRAHEMMSMSEYPAGRATREYRAAVDQAAALVEERKAAVSPFYHDRLEGLLDAYARRLAQWTNDYNRNGASCPSVLICGPANFPTRKKEKQNAREETLWREYDEIKGLLSRIETTGAGPIDLTDPHARELLTDRLHSLEAELDRDKKLNAYYRKHNTFVGFPGLSDDKAAKLTADFADTRARCGWVDKPCPDYELASLRGKIKRVKARLEDLDKLEAKQADPDAGTKFDGGEIVRNADENRLQILFDDIPDADLRAALKSHGFRWSPRNKAWQRQLTANAEYDAREILGLN